MLKELLYYIHYTLTGHKDAKAKMIVKQSDLIHRME